MYAMVLNTILINVIIIECKNYIECKNGNIDMKLNKVYGVISTTTDDIKTIPNEVYGITESGSHHGVSRWL